MNTRAHTGTLHQTAWYCSFSPLASINTQTPQAPPWPSPQPRASLWGHYGLWHAPLAPWMLMPSGGSQGSKRTHAHTHTQSCSYIHTRLCFNGVHTQSIGVHKQIHTHTHTHTHRYRVDRPHSCSHVHLGRHWLSDQRSHRWQIACPYRAGCPRLSKDPCWQRDEELEEDGGVGTEKKIMYPARFFYLPLCVSSSEIGMTLLVISGCLLIFPLPPLILLFLLLSTPALHLLLERALHLLFVL